MSEILRSINPAMANLLLPPTRAATRPMRQRREPAPYVDEEEERTLAGSMRDKSLSMIGAVGNLLDLPGSMVRDVGSSVAQGKFVNPFDQLLSPFSADNRTTGKQLLQQTGITDNKDSWGNAIAGFGAEVAMDPLTYMTFGASALGKSGKLASKAGMFDELSSVAARKANKPIGEVGKSQARLTTTLGDMAQYGTEKTAQRARELLKANPELADEAFGGLAGFGLPFMQPMAVAGQGAKSQAVAKGMDTAARAIRHAKIPGTDVKPINSVLNLFDAPALGTKSPMWQAIARHHSRKKDVKSADALMDTNRWAVELEKAGLVGEDAADMLLQGVEGVVPINSLPDAMQPIARQMRVQNEEMLARGTKEGVLSTKLSDDEIDYAARFLIRSRGIHGKRSKTIFNADDPSNQGRKDFIRNVPGGTKALKELLSDKAINEAIDKVADVETVRKLVEAKSNGWLPDEFKAFDPKNEKAVDGWVTKEGRYKSIAEWMGGLSKETRDAGVFGNHPILDHQARKMAFEDSINATETVALALSQPDILLPASKAANAAADGSMTVGEILAKLKMDLGDVNGGLGRKIMKSKGMAPDDDAIKVMRDMRLSKENAEELMSIHKVLSGPDAINDLISTMDSVVNYSKGMWTSVWPAFHVRNRVSGALQNMALGIWSRSGDVQAGQILKGKIIEGAAKKPWVREIWEREQAELARINAATPPGGAVSPTVGPGPLGTVAPQSPPPAGFYSKLAQATDQKVSGKVGWDQYKKTMKGAGVKDEEILDLDLEAFFKSGPKTKKEIQEYVEQSTPDIEIVEKVSSSSPKYSPRSWPDNQAEFEGFKIPGGDEGSYREVLIKQKHPGTYEKEAESFRREMRKKYGDGWTDNLSPEDAARHQEVLKGVERGSKLENRGAYSGPHWREQNVIAHARLDDITNPDGTRTLRIGEIQSDWHQEGRKSGYELSPEQKDAIVSEKTKEAIESGWEARLAGTGRWRVVTNDGIGAGMYTAQNKEEAIRLAIASNLPVGVIPDGPFKKSWGKLAFRQSLRMAIEEGYDEIGLVVGRDAAKAVGGPVDELAEAYSIMLKDAKDYTKKYKSYVGETQVAKTAKAQTEPADIDLAFSAFRRDADLQADVSLAHAPWEDVDSPVPAPLGKIVRVGKPDPEIPGVSRYSFSAYKGDELLGEFAVQEEAKAALAQAVGRYKESGPRYDGGLHIFKITDEMRRDILDEGQALYSVAPRKGEVSSVSSALQQPKSIPNVGNKEINQWTKADIDAVRDPKNFKKISPAHAKLDGFLNHFVAKDAIRPEDADIMRLIYAQTDARFLPDAVRAGRSLRTQTGGKVGKDSIGFAEPKPWFAEDRISLLSKASSRAKDQRSAYNEGTRVMLHELMHIVYFSALRSTDPKDLAMLREFHVLAKGSGKKPFIDEFLSGGNTLSQAQYHAGATKHSLNITNPEYEQFAEFAAHSIMRRKIPTGAIGTVINTALDWLRTQLEKLAKVVGLEPKMRSRLDEIIDELAGFNAPPDLTKTLAGKQAANVPPGATPGVPPSVVPPGVTPPTAPPGATPGPGAVPPVPAVLTDEEATRIIGRMASSQGVIGKFEGNATSIVGQPTGQSGDIIDTLSGIPRPGSNQFSKARVARKAAGIEPGTSWNPVNVRGVGGREESGFGIAAAGEEIGNYTEGLNRLGPWITMMDRGYDAAEAAKKAGAAQVLYGNKNYTPFEQQVMARVFPFYKFSRGSMPVVARNLMEKPGGMYGTIVKGNNRAQGDGELAPDYVRDTANIPVDRNNPILSAIAGTPPEGTDRYVTGFGLMHEDLLGFGPSVRGAGLEALSRMNPFIKGPLEWSTGQTFFQRGPEGGRDLDKLDPTLGRLAANVMGQTGQKDSDKFPMWFEQLVANSPIARATTTARSLTDPRKRSQTIPGMPGAASILNTLTGARVSDVSPGAKDAILRDMLNSEMQGAGASVFERVYFSKEELAKMTPQARANAIKLQGLANVLARRSKERKAERDAAEAKKGK